MPFKDKEKENEYRRQKYAENKEKASARAARYYQNNKEKCKNRYQKLITRNKEYARNIKKAGKCIDCGESRWQCLDFDHINPAEKEFHIRDLIHKGLSIKKLKAEIAKCQLRCANCHRFRHATEDGWDQ